MFLGKIGFMDGPMSAFRMEEMGKDLVGGGGRRGELFVEQSLENEKSRELRAFEAGY